MPLLKEGVGLIQEKHHAQNEDITPIKRVERVYLFLEQLATTEAHALSNSGKAKIRLCQAELQRLRLLLLDKEKNDWGG